MKKFIYGAMMLMAFGAFQSCIDDSESLSVTTVRNAKAEELKSIAALNQAQADAALLIAQAEAALKNSEAALNKAELDSLQAELELRMEQIKQEMLEAQLEYMKLAATLDQQIYATYIQAYVDAQNNLLDAQSVLNQTQITLAQLKSGLIDAQNSAAQKVQNWQKTINNNNIQIAGIQAQIDTYEDYQDMSSEELQEALAEANSEWSAASTKAYAINSQRNAALTAKNQAYNDLYGSSFYQALQEFMNPNAPNVVYNYVKGVGYYGYYVDNKATGQQDFVPMITIPTYTNDTIYTTASQGEAMYTYQVMETFYNYVAEGIESYIDDQVYADVDEDELADAQKAYETTQANLTEATTQNSEAYQAYTEANATFTTAQESYDAAIEDLAQAYDNELSSVSEYNNLMQQIQYIQNTANNLGNYEAWVTWYTYLVGEDEESPETGNLEYYEGEVKTQKDNLVTFQTQLENAIEEMGTWVESQDNEDLTTAWEALEKEIGGTNDEGTYTAEVVANYTAFGTYNASQNIYSNAYYANNTAEQNYEALQNAKNNASAFGAKLEALYDVLQAQSSNVKSYLTAYQETTVTYNELQVSYTEANTAATVARNKFQALQNLTSSSAADGGQWYATMQDLQNQLEYLQGQNEYLQAQIDNDTTVTSKENAIAECEAQIEYYTNLVKAYQEQADAAMKALENYAESMGDGSNSGNTGSGDNTGDTGAEE